MPEELAVSLHKVARWMGDPRLHMANNEYQWADAFERHPGEPSPQAIARLIPTSIPRSPGQPRGVEPPASFWPKFEHRFRPTEELWTIETLPAAIRAVERGEEAIARFDSGHRGARRTRRGAPTRWRNTALPGGRSGDLGPHEAASQRDGLVLRLRAHAPEGDSPQSQVQEGSFARREGARGRTAEMAAPGSV